MSETVTAPVRVGVYLEPDQDYYLSPVGDPDVVADERRHFSDGSWSAYCLLTVVECPHCGQLYSTGRLGGVVAESTTLVDSVVWDGDPYLHADGDYLACHLRDLVDEEKGNPTPPSAWVPLPRAGA